MLDLLSNKYIHVIALGIILIVIIQITKKITRRYIITKNIEPHRRKIILNFMYIIYYIVSAIALLFILGVNLKEVAIFASSILAVVGIGFFAQWSILSNLTASVILFFYHPMRIGDRIKILDKEYDLTGTVKDITGFYVLIDKEDSERQITIPNTVILYKGIELLRENDN